MKLRKEKSRHVLTRVYWKKQYSTYFRMRLNSRLREKLLPCDSLQHSIKRAFNNGSGKNISTDPTFVLSDDSNNYFVIQVADTGKGIPETARTHIFDPFYQVSAPQTANDNVNGTGIGLSLTQSVVHFASRCNQRRFQPAERKYIHHYTSE